MPLPVSVPPRHASIARRRRPSLGALLVSLTVWAAAAKAEPAALKAGFEAAWARQPEAQALPAWRDAVEARRQSADAWTPEPPALELTHKTDRYQRDDGSRELEATLAVPLWLPGERGRSAALANAEATAVESRAQAARLRVAAAVREAWWNLQRARVDRDVARDQLDHARRIADDVGRRVQAGDLAPADRHQADGAVAAAESAVATASAAAVSAARSLQALTGREPAPDTTPADLDAEPEPPAPPAATHAALIDLVDRTRVAEQAASLATAQGRANPELLLATTRERGAHGEPANRTVTLGVRIPFGAGARHDQRVATAQAEAAELRAQLALEHERLGAERASAQARVEAARTQVAAAERRAALAREARGFFERSFRLGETDLPLRLRIEAEAVDAERQSARSRIELAAAVSAWRQALGLLP